jgi:GT2 family glycosyltransferase
MDNQRRADIRIGIVLVTYKSNDVLSGCLACLSAALHVADLDTRKSATVVLVNNNPDQTLDIPNNVPWESILINSDENVGFSPAVNSALPFVADADYVLLLNPDTCLAPNSLSIMIDLAIERQAALVGPLLTDEHGRPYGASERPFHSIHREIGRQLLGLTRYHSHYGRKAFNNGEARCLTGACLLIERVFLDSVGGLDTTIHMYLEDVMLCWQAHMAGRPVVLAYDAHCQHALGGSTGGINFHTSIALYLMILWARAEFVRRRMGAASVYVMRLLFVVGACLRLVLGDAQMRGRQQAVIWWAITSGKSPEWRDGPNIELPAFLDRSQRT